MKSNKLTTMFVLVLVSLICVQVSFAGSCPATPTFTPVVSSTPTPPETVSATPTPTPPAQHNYRLTPDARGEVYYDSVTEQHYQKMGDQYYLINNYREQVPVSGVQGTQADADGLQEPVPVQLPIPPTPSVEQVSLEGIRPVGEGVGITTDDGRFRVVDSDGNVHFFDTREALLRSQYASSTPEQIQIADAAPAEGLPAGFDAWVVENGEIRKLNHGEEAETTAYFSMAAALNAFREQKDIINALEGGETVDELLSAGATPEQLLAAGVSQQTLAAAQEQLTSLQQRIAEGQSVTQLLAADYTPEQLSAAGFSDSVIASAVVALTPITAALEAGATGDQLLAAGYTEHQVRAAAVASEEDDVHTAEVARRLANSMDGKTDEELKIAGFSEEQIADAKALQEQREEKRKEDAWYNKISSFLNTFTYQPGTFASLFYDEADVDAMIQDWDSGFARAVLGGPSQLGDEFCRLDETDTDLAGVAMSMAGGGSAHAEGERTDTTAPTALGQTTVSHIYKLSWVVNPTGCIYAVHDIVLRGLSGSHDVVTGWNYVELGQNKRTGANMVFVSLPGVYNRICIKFHDQLHPKTCLTGLGEDFEVCQNLAVIT